MRRVASVLLAGALVGACFVPGVVSAGQARLSVCHRVAGGAYDLIEIGEPAYATHLQHGDRAIGDGVPGMGPAWVFDLNCRPFERPLALLVRVWSTDQTGVQHDLARLNDTNYDGIPSAGDTLTLGAFPYFTSSALAFTYGAFTATTHTVTVAWVSTYPDHVGLGLDSEAGSWSIVQWDPTADFGWYDETYTEYTGLDSTFFIDSTPPDGVAQWDYTLIMSGSPGRPAPNAGWAAGPASTDLIDIEFLWAY